jgi:hypothetical protein
MDATAHRQPQPLPPVDDDDAILRQTITDVALLSLNVDAPSVAVAEAFKAAERDLDVDAVWPALAEAREGQPPPPEVDEDNNTTFRELGMVVDGKLAYVAILEDRPEPHHVPANQYDFIPMFDNLADGGGAAAMEEEEARDGPGDLPRYGLSDGAHGGDIGLGRVVLHGFDALMEDPPEPADQYESIAMFDKYVHEMMQEARAGPVDLNQYGLGDGAHGGEIDLDLGHGRVILHGFDVLMEDPPEPADQYESIAMFDKYVHEMMQEARAGSGDLNRYGLGDGAHGGEIDPDLRL